MPKISNNPSDHRDRVEPRATAPGIVAHRYSPCLRTQRSYPAYDPEWRWPSSTSARSVTDATLRGIHSIGYDGEGFCFDNEQPAHEVLLQPVRCRAGACDQCRWLEFIADSGYTTPTLWLSDGWATVEAEGWNAPGYWRQVDGAWCAMTLGGLRPVEPAQPVCHVSYYEADAFARWAGKDLPSEAEWEVAAKAARLPMRSAWFGNGRAAPIRLIRVTKRLPARLASTTANSWSTRWYCAVDRWRRPPGIRARPTAISFTRRRAGNSLDCGSPSTNTEQPPSNQKWQDLCKPRCAPRRPSKRRIALPPMSSPAFRQNRNNCRRSIFTT